MKSIGSRVHIVIYRHMKGLDETYGTINQSSIIT